MTTDPKKVCTNEQLGGDVYSDCRMEWPGGSESSGLDFVGQRCHCVAKLGTHAWMVQRGTSFAAGYGLGIGIAVTMLPLSGPMS